MTVQQLAVDSVANLRGNGFQRGEHGRNGLGRKHRVQFWHCLIDNVAAWALHLTNNVGLHLLAAICQRGISVREIDVVWGR